MLKRFTPAQRIASKQDVLAAPMFCFVLWFETSVSSHWARVNNALRARVPFAGISIFYFIVRSRSTMPLPAVFLFHRD
jgi:hypothetical protein